MQPTTPTSPNVAPIPTAQPMVTPPSQVFTPPPTGGDRNKKLLLAGGGVVMLLVGLGSAIILLRSQASVQTEAWDCDNYTFSVSETGVVLATNNSTRNEPLQRADVYINTAKTNTFDVPALAAGQSQQIGQVTVPAEGGFQWQVRGTADCSASGNYAALSARCVNIVAYDTSWKQLTNAQLAALAPGDKVRLTVTGNTTSGEFSKARFTINNVLQPETVLKRPASADFYQEYTIPASTSAFSVNAEIYHTTVNQWF